MSRTEVTSMTVPDRLPARMRMDGQAIFQQIKSYFDTENKEYFKHPNTYNGISMYLEPNILTSMKYFDLTDFHCECNDFQNQGVCKHWVAMDHYFHSLPQVIQKRIRKSSHKSSFASQLIPTLPSEELQNELLEEKAEAPSLALHGQFEIRNHSLSWTLKLKVEQAPRAYVIKDIAHFIFLIFQQEDYFVSQKIGTINLSLDQFNKASQNLILYIKKYFIDRNEHSYSNFSYGISPRDCGRYLETPVSYLNDLVPLFQALDVFQYVTSKAEYPLIFLDDNPFIPEEEIFKVVKSDNHYEIINTAYFGFIIQNKLWIRHNHFHIIKKEHRYFLDKLATWIYHYQESSPLIFSKENKAELMQICNIISNYVPISIPDELQIHDFISIFAFSKTRNEIAVNMVWSFGEKQAHSKQDLLSLPYTYQASTARKIYHQLLSAGFKEDFHSLSKIKVVDFFLKELPRFRTLGQVQLDESLEKFLVEDPAVIDIFDDEGFLSVQFDFSMISEDEVKKAIQALWNQESHYQTKQGKVLVFDDESLKVAQSLQDLRAKFSDGKIKMHKSRAYSLSETFKDNEHVNFSRDFKKMAYDLTHPEEFDIKPYEINAKLRSYQKEGVKWLSMLDHYHFGGILADDMGLGKTLQTITLLEANLKPEQKALILAPASLLYNWKEEFRKFVPHKQVEVAYGTKTERIKQIDKSATITITSYPSFRPDLEHYQKQSYDYLILDEAQMIKNSQTKIAQALREFDVKTCYALSGTPIENRLEEIWSIFHIVLPGLLPSKKEFSKLSPQLVGKLIQPFVLRRKKDEVLTELPELSEHLYSNELTSSQKTLYLAQLRRMQEMLAGASADEIKHHKIEILAGLTRLRQICNTPALFLEDYTGDSGKMDSLFELLDTIRKKESRPLIFSQFTSMLDLIEQELEKKGLSHFKITGQTPSDKRQEMVNLFNQGEKDCFLISLKAGGTGLNLTGADTVILCDLWWNPAVEMQAIGRSHRLGQTKQVDVYRLITLGTIEEKIQELQESKKELFNTVLEGQESRSNLSVDDIKEILGVE